MNVGDDAFVVTSDEVNECSKVCTCSCTLRQVVYVVVCAAARVFREKGDDVSAVYTIYYLK